MLLHFLHSEMPGQILTTKMSHGSSLLLLATQWPGGRVEGAQDTFQCRIWSCQLPPLRVCTKDWEECLNEYSGIGHGPEVSILRLTCEELELVFLVLIILIWNHSSYRAYRLQWHRLQWQIGYSDSFLQFPNDLFVNKLPLLTVRIRLHWHFSHVPTQSL